MKKLAIYLVAVVIIVASYVAYNVISVNSKESNPDDQSVEKAIAEMTESAAADGVVSEVKVSDEFKEFLLNPINSDKKKFVVGLLNKEKDEFGDIVISRLHIGSLSISQDLTKANLEFYALGEDENKSKMIIEDELFNLSNDKINLSFSIKKEDYGYVCLRQNIKNLKFYDFNTVRRFQSTFCLIIISQDFVDRHTYNYRETIERDMKLYSSDFIKHLKN